MGNLVLKTEQQITGSMAKTVLARTGLNDLSPGSILLTLLQAAAQEDFAQYYQMLQIVRNYNIDTTTGTDLDNRAFEYKLTRLQALPASGTITISRGGGFQKIFTTFYTGFRSRIAGDTQLFLNNAAKFPTSGPAQTLIIGRGTPNEEEVTYTPAGSNPQNNVNYFVVTLNTPLVHDHSLQETVILKQGSDILIPSGTVVQVPASGTNPQVTFSTTVNATLLAGEAGIDNVNITCNQSGTIGNIGVNAITGTTAFPNPPFSAAIATNDSAFSNGQDKETDTALRNRIKSAIQAISQSTTSGISNAINGLVDTTTAKRVVSSNIILPTEAGLPVKIIIDDGTGFEPDFGNQGEEIIVAAAKGGETRLQTKFFPIVKAQVETLAAGPFDMSQDGLTLTVNVGAQSETLTFFQNMFKIPSAATAFEVVAAINANSLLLEARTANNGSNVVINAQADTNEEIQVVGGTANSRLNFSTNLVKTFYLYKNDILLSKDGETAFIDSGNAEPYNFSGASQTLSVEVDGKSANVQTVTISQSMFPSPAAAATATAAQVVAIINNQLAGATASVANSRVRITSNTPLSSKSKIQINASSAQATLGFSTSAVVGKNNDYTLNPELGIIQLNTALAANDLVTAGTRNTRAFLTASIPQNYAFAGGETLQLEVDGGSTQTITFSAGTNQAAQAVANFINQSLVGGTAVTRTLGSATYLEIRTNTLDPTQGSIRILSSSTANSIFGFTTDTTVLSIFPHTAYEVAQNVGPYTFVEDDSLVVVMDNNPGGETFNIPMDYASNITSGISPSFFGASGLITPFPISGSLNDFWLVFKSGANTTTGAIGSVTNPSSNTFQYNYKTPPTNFHDFGVNDQASFSSMNNASNDGNFLITGVTTVGTTHAAVLDNTVANPASLTPSNGDRYLVASGANTAVNPNSVIDLNVSNPSALSPSVGDRHIIAAGANNTTQPDVQGRYADSTNPSVQQVNGYRYIVDGTGLNAWAGHDNQIATYNGVGTPGWVFTTPSAGDVVFSIADNTFYQFDGISGTWLQNSWGGKAGKVAQWTGTAWTFTTPLDQEVRNVTSLSHLYQYSVSSNTWTRNDWGGNANQLAQWNGSTWVYDSPLSANDVVFVTSQNNTYQYSGSAWAIFTFWVRVTNLAGTAESGSSGNGLLGQRRQISTYNGISGAITLATPARATPSLFDAFIILPATRTNVVLYLNNTAVSSLSAFAFIELVDQGQKIQISSQQDGSDGYVQVTGGRANNQLQFSNTLDQGLQAYSNYTGLIKLVNSTIYGDETDFTSFPGVGAAGIKFSIRPPTVLENQFVINVTLSQGVSLSTIQNELESKVIAYVNTLGIANEVILSSIIEILMQVSGVVDVSISSPSANVVVSQNELARTKASLITVNVNS